MAGGALAAVHVGGVRPSLGQALLPSPDQSGIEHIVVVMMENRSFDHMLGWVEGADGRQHGFYAKKDLPFFADAAAQWTVCDRYFSAIMAGTFANRVYQHAAQTDRLANTFELSALPTIWDRLALAEALEFTSPSLRAKSFTVPDGPFGGVCVPRESVVPDEADGEWLPLLKMAGLFGWPVGARLSP